MATGSNAILTSAYWKDLFEKLRRFPMSPARMVHEGTDDVTSTHWALHSKELEPTCLLVTMRHQAIIKDGRVGGHTTTHKWRVTVTHGIPETVASMETELGPVGPPDACWQFVAREVQAVMAGWGLYLAGLTRGDLYVVDDMSDAWERERAVKPE